MSNISVLLVDDHNIVRQGLRALLIAEGDITIVAEAQTGREAVQLAANLHPEVVVMDLAMPLLMLGHNLSCPSRQPDVDVEFQRHDDLCDGDGSVGGIGFSRLAADTGSRQEIGIALSVFPRRQGWHIRRRRGRIKRVARENHGFLVDHHRSFAGRARSWGITRRMAAEKEPSQQHARHNKATQVDKVSAGIFRQTTTRTTS